MLSFVELPQASVDRRLWVAREGDLSFLVTYLEDGRPQQWSASLARVGPEQPSGYGANVDIGMFAFGSFEATVEACEVMLRALTTESEKR